jgi:beta-glucosidase
MSSKHHKNSFVIRARRWVTAAYILLCFPALIPPSVCRGSEPDPFTAPEALKKPLYLDSSARLDDRVRDLVGRLTLEEKALVLDHNGPNLVRFGLRSDKWNQCLNGVRWSSPTTLFPICTALGATWDPSLVREVAEALSDEARAIHNIWRNNPGFSGMHSGLIYRAPVINISRNPYWGRIYEVYSEDSFLTGRMAVAYVKGLQGDDPNHLKVAATLKHFAVNNVEKDRMKLDAHVPERWLREYWLPHWKEAVIEGGASSLMASYNAINGVPNNINSWLLTDLLKKEWGHSGFVVSDLGGVDTMVKGHESGAMSYQDAVAKSLEAGCDFSDKEFLENIPAAVREGKLSVARLDDAVTRVLKIRFRLGEFDPPGSNPWKDLKPDLIDGPAHRSLALRAARESMVLLKNDKAILPLDPRHLQKLAVIGPCADVVHMNSYNGKATNGITPLQGLREALPGCSIRHVTGGFISGKKGFYERPPQPVTNPAIQIKEAVDAAREADAVVLFLGTDSSVEKEGLDRPSLGLPGNQQELAEKVIAANPRTIVVQMTAGPLTWPWAKEHVPAILQAWWPGSEGGRAIAEVLLGKCDPGGHLPYTVYASEEQVPPQSEYDISKGFTYMFLKGEPLWPFGHGLSYTSFGYKGLRLEKKELNPGGTLRISLDITNTGERTGDEVVQIYVHPPDSHIPMPSKQLRAFRRVSLNRGETQSLDFTIPIDSLAHWEETSHAFKVSPGTYRLTAGSSSADQRLEAGFRILAP